MTEKEKEIYQCESFEDREEITNKDIAILFGWIISILLILSILSCHGYKKVKIHKKPPNQWEYKKHK